MEDDVEVVKIGLEVVGGDFDVVKKNSNVVSKSFR